MTGRPLGRPGSKRLFTYEAEATWQGECHVHPVKYISRKVYQLRHGALPGPHVQVLHHCDNPWCIRDEHHFTGSMLDNMADAIAKGRSFNQVKTPEQEAKRRASISARQRGRPLTACQRAALSVALKGKPKSPEHRAKLAAHLKRVHQARREGRL